MVMDTCMKVPDTPSALVTLNTTGLPLAAGAVNLKVWVGEALGTAENVRLEQVEGEPPERAPALAVSNMWRGLVPTT